MGGVGGVRGEFGGTEGDLEAVLGDGCRFERGLGGYREDLGGRLGCEGFLWGLGG